MSSSVNKTKVNKRFGWSRWCDVTTTGTDHMIYLIVTAEPLSNENYCNVTVCIPTEPIRVIELLHYQLK